MNEAIITLVNTFFEGLGIIITSITINIEESDINIRIETPDSALIIGMHGANIEAFQHLLSRMIEKQGHKYAHVHLEVNDYMKAKDERLFRFLESKISFVTSTGKNSTIANLNAYERKKAHNYIAERGIPELTTRSDGEGQQRVLILEYTGKIILGSGSRVPQVDSSSDTLLTEDGVGI